MAEHQKSSAKSKEKPMVSSRLPKVFSVFSRPSNSTLSQPLSSSEYKQTTDLLSPLKVTKRQYNRLQRLLVQTDAQQTLAVSLVPSASLKLTDCVVVSVLNSSSHGAVKKALHAPSLHMYTIRQVTISTRETRTILADWIRIWSMMQEDCEQLLHIETSFWNQPEGHVSIIVEYVNSGSLQSLLDSLGTVQESILRVVAKEATEGLKFLHSKGITHGQVTPSQVLLSRSGRAKLDIAVKPHMGGKSSHQSGFEPFGKRPEQSPEEDIFDLGTTLLVCAIGGIEWMELYSSSTDQTCCLYHSLMRAKVAPLLTRISPAFQSFLCACLQFNIKRRLRASDLLTHDWLLQTNPDPGIKVSFRELLNVSFQWVAPSEYQIAAERQLDRICENLRMVLVETKPNIETREEVTELAMDLGLGEENVRQRLSSIYRFA